MIKTIFCKIIIIVINFKVLVNCESHDMQIKEKIQYLLEMSISIACD